MKRPYVICHMTPSVDGRIVTTKWKLPASGWGEYETIHDKFKADAWIIGRVSMETFAGRGKVPRGGGSRIPKTDYIAFREAKSHAIAIDPSGKLAWKSGMIDDDHVIAILTEKVSSDYLAYLQEKGVSYLIGGKSEVNLRRVLAKLAKEFKIKKLLLEGGGKINGAFLEADLIDELSLLIAPIADGSVATPTLFDAKEGRGPTRNLKLISLQKRKADILWVRYKVKR